MWATTPFSALLGLRYPIVQGPFGGGLSSVDLAVAVAEGGGLGSFGAHQLAPEGIIALAAELRARTSYPFALNLWLSNRDPGLDPLPAAAVARLTALLRPLFAELGLEPGPPAPAAPLPNVAAQLDAILEARPPVFSFVFGIPPAPMLAECRARGILTLGTATTLAEALALEAAGVDAIVATGMEAGGHRPSFLRPTTESLTGTLALVPAVVDHVRVPVVAAGGIADGRGIAAALALGAHGVQIGTAFLACDESGASPPHRAALFSAAARETVLTRTLSGRLARGLRNRLTDTLAPGEADALPYPAQSWLTGQLRVAALTQNRPDLLTMWSGQAAPLLRHHRAAELLAWLVADTTARLRELAAG